ncbi:hypothetical protein [Kaarinaea lacus]
MDMLNLDLVEANINSSRDMDVGPSMVRSPGYGVSMLLPSGWIAASVLGEVYGIESMLQKNGRVYVSGQNASIADIRKSHADTIDLGFMQLLPTSAPVIEGNTVSMHCKVEGVGTHKIAYVTTVVTTNNNAITFVALFEESVAAFFKDFVNKIAASVEDLVA